MVGFSCKTLPSEDKLKMEKLEKAGKLRNWQYSKDGKWVSWAQAKKTGLGGCFKHFWNFHAKNWGNDLF